VNFLGDKGMIGELSTTGILIEKIPGNNKWIAIISFQDESLMDLRGVNGTLSNKHGDDLLAACRTVLEKSEQMGIKMLSLPNKKPKLYVKELFADEIWEQVKFAANVLDFELGLQ
jgi:hypothetical protein